MKFLLSFIWVLVLSGCGDECENAVNYYKNQRVNLILKRFLSKDVLLLFMGLVLLQVGMKSIMILVEVGGYITKNI